MTYFWQGIRLVLYFRVQFELFHLVTEKQMKLDEMFLNLINIYLLHDNGEYALIYISTIHIFSFLIIKKYGRLVELNVLQVFVKLK